MYQVQLMPYKSQTYLVQILLTHDFILIDMIILWEFQEQLAMFVS